MVVETPGDSIWERLRIAQRLHDSVGQTLTGLRMMLESQLDDGGEASSELLALWVKTCTRALDEVRGVIGELGPGPSDHGLEVALWRMISEIGGEGVRVHVSGGTTSLTERGGAEALLLVAREAVSNAVKHREGGCLEVSLEYRADRAILRTRSAGAPRRAARGLGLGLGLVREAVAEAGGEFQTTVVDGCFQMVAVVPAEGRSEHG